MTTGTQASIQLQTTTFVMDSDCFGRNSVLLQCRESTHLAISQSDMHTGVGTGHLEECKVCRRE